MKNIKYLGLVIILVWVVGSVSFGESYTGVIINTNGNTEGSYVNIKINDGTNRNIQATYILDTKIKTIETEDLYQIYAIAGRNPLIIDAEINKNEINITNKIENLDNPIILII